MTPDDHKAVARRFWEELWNQWRYDLIPELLDPRLTFRGSLGVEVRGHDGFRHYMDIVRTAFPDFHNTIDDLLADGDLLAARLTLRGTHYGPVLGIVPTGKPVSYRGMALFRFKDGKIVDGWVLGDALGLKEQLDPFPRPGAPA